MGNKLRDLKEAELKIELEENDEQYSSQLC